MILYTTLTQRPRDTATVGGMAGLVTLLLALVLGLLVYTAFTVYSTQQSEAQGLGPVVIELDVLLEQYGSEALRGRIGLREALGRSRRRFFGDLEHGPQAHTFEETRAASGFHMLSARFGITRDDARLFATMDLAKRWIRKSHAAMP